MSGIKKGFGIVAELAKTARIVFSNAKAEWGNVKEELPHIRRVNKIYVDGVDFENPDQKDLEAAQHIARMVKQFKGNCSSDVKSDRRAAMFLFGDINQPQLFEKVLCRKAASLFSDVDQSQVSGGAMDVKALDGFAGFAVGCIKLCDKHGVSYSPDEALEAEGNRPDVG